MTFVALVGCQNIDKPTKVDYFDKCLEQANQTFEEDLIIKSNFVMSCMSEKNFSFDENCVTNHKLQLSQAHMFEVLKKLTSSCYLESK